MNGSDPLDESVAEPSEAPPGDDRQRFYPLSPNWGENAKLLVIATGFLLAVIGVYLIRNVLAIAAFAALIAFLVAPLIRLGHEKLHIPRGISLLIAYVLVFVGTTAFGWLVANEIVESIQELDPVC